MYCEFPCVHNPSLGQSWTSYESEQRGLIKPSHFDHFGLFVKAQEPITQVLHPSTPPNPGFDLNLRHLKAISALTLVNWLAYTVIYHPYGEKIAKFWYMVGLQNGNIWCIYICIYIYITKWPPFGLRQFHPTRLRHFGTGESPCPPRRPSLLRRQPAQQERPWRTKHWT